MLRKLNAEFRGNGLLDELYSKLVRNGAVMHMKNSCSPTAADVKISTPARAVEAAGRIGAEMAERITATGVRAVGDPALLSALPAIPTQPGPPAAEARIPPRSPPGPLRRAPRRPRPRCATPRRRSPAPCTRRRRRSWFESWGTDV
ncbi:hypothetical protein ACWDE0_03325 [Streptomyces sp. 900105755]